MLDLNRYRYIKRTKDGFVAAGIPISMILSFLADGEDVSGLQATFPELTSEVLREVFDFVSELVMKVEYESKEIYNSGASIDGIVTIVDGGGMVN